MKTKKALVYSKENAKVSNGECEKSTPKNRISKGYRYVYAPNSQEAKLTGSYKGFVLEHRLVMESYMGRELSSKEDVHHIDFNTLNNSLNNLMLLSKNEHTRLHHLLKAGVIGKEECYSKEKVQKALDVHQRRCMHCGKDLSVLQTSKSSIKQCPQCAKIAMRKVNRPLKEDLLRELINTPIERVGQQYGVSGNAVRKWCKAYRIDPKQYASQPKFSAQAREKALSPKAIAKRVQTQKEWYRKNKSPCGRGVVCYTKEHQFVKEYAQIADAVLDGFSDSPISRCCKKKLKTYKGYIWRYKGEDF